VGSLEKRLEALEGRFDPTHGWNPAQELEREAIIAELKRLEEEREPLRERAKCEAEEGQPQRLRAIEELDRMVEERERRGA